MAERVLPVYLLGKDRVLPDPPRLSVRAGVPAPWCSASLQQYDGVSDEVLLPDMLRSPRDTLNKSASPPHLSTGVPPGLGNGGVPPASTRLRAGLSAVLSKCRRDSVAGLTACDQQGGCHF